MIKLKKPAVILTVILAGLYLLFMAGYYATSEPGFCRNCHMIKPYVASWEQYPHRTVKCLNCHESRGFLGKLESKTRGLNHYYLSATNQDTVPIRAQIYEQNCLHCHLGNNTRYPNALPPTNRDINHYEQIRQNKPCISCHAEVGHQTKLLISPDILPK